MFQYPKHETLTVEFKSDRKCLGYDELYEALVALANTEGGVLYLGVEDWGEATGLHEQHKNIQEVSAKITNHTNPAMYPKLEIVDWDGKQVLSIEVPMAHQLTMTTSGKYMRRRIKQDGTPEAIPMPPAEIMQRLSYIQAVDPSAQIAGDIPAEKALSPLEHERLRNMVRTYHGDSTLLDLTDEELDGALDFVKEENGIMYPTVAGMLMVGHEEYIRKFIPSNEVLFQVMEGTNVLYNSPAMHFSLLQIFEKCDVLFQSRIVEQEIQIGLFRVPMPNYEKDAFREGFVNALVHRDYFRIGAVQVQLLGKSMTICSPGGFPEGINPDNILSAHPNPRNKTLAEAAKRIGLAERTGRGVDKIYSAMLRSGHDMPDYTDSDSTSVMLRLNSANMDENYIRMLVSEEQKLGEMMKVDALIALAALKNERRMTIAQLSKSIQKKEADTKVTMEWLVETGMVEGVGNGAARHYMLSKQVYAATGSETAYTRQKGLSTIQEKEMIIAHTQNYGKITRTVAADLCKCSKYHASWLLNQLKQDGRLNMNGKGCSIYYTLAE